MTKKLLHYILFLLLPLSLLHSQELKVVSFNICNSLSHRSEGAISWKNRSSAVIKMFNEEKPTIFCVQDAMFDQVSFLDKNLPYRYRRIGLSTNNETTRGTYNAIYYNINKMELLSYGTYWLSKTPREITMGWDAQSYRTVTIAKMRVIGTSDTILCVNTKLDHNRIARLESVKLILNLIKELATPTTHVIICGDMNADISDPVISQFIRSGFLSSRETASSTDHKYTYNGYGKEKPSIVDHFFTRGIKTKQYKTITKNYGRPYISNHYPIEIIFIL